MALLSAGFAALTAVRAKVGAKGVNPDLATAIRPVVILVIAWGIFLARDHPAEVWHLSARTWVFLGLSGVATGLSRLRYRALQLGSVSQVAPIDKLSVALVSGLSVVFLGETLTLEAALGVALIIGGTLILIR